MTCRTFTIGRVAVGCNVRCGQGFRGSRGGTSDYGDGRSWRHAKPLDRTVAASAWSVLEHAVHGGATSRARFRDEPLPVQ